MCHYLYKAKARKRINGCLCLCFQVVLNKTPELKCRKISINDLKRHFWHLWLFIIIISSIYLFFQITEREISKNITILSGSCRVVPECSAHCLIIHIWFVFVFAPQPGHCFWVDQLEDPRLRISPFDVTRADLSILQQLHQELPQVKGVSA